MLYILNSCKTAEDNKGNATASADEEHFHDLIRTVSARGKGESFITIKDSIKKIGSWFPSIDLCRKITPASNKDEIYEQYCGAREVFLHSELDYSLLPVIILAYIEQLLLKCTELDELTKMFGRTIGQKMI